MSTLVNLAIFPLDKGISASPYIARILKIIKDSGLPYQFGPMSTVIEGEWQEVMDTITCCFRELSRDCDRIYMSVTIDYRKSLSNRIIKKVQSVEKLL